MTPIGTGVKGLWDGLKARKSAVRQITRFDPSPFPSRVAGEVDDFRPLDHMERRNAKRLDRFSQFGLAAARLAVADADSPLDGLPRERGGVMMGSALGGVAYAELQAANFHAQGIRHVRPNLALTVFGGAVSCNIAIEFGLTGPNATNSMSCAAGTVALGYALDAIRSNRADVMLAGGAEAPLSPLCFGAFAIIKAMSTRNDDPSTASRPFDSGRDGFVMGEGSAVLLIEELGRARARGAPIYAEVAGFGLTNDAHHMTAPRPDGAEARRAMQLALEDAGVSPEQVDYINAHGSSTVLNDPVETSAVKQLFGKRAYQLAMSGTKGYYGHPLGASGAIEAAICALGFRHKWLPPTLNLERADPACDLSYVNGGGTETDAAIMLTNSFGFGGVNASLVLRAC